MRDLGAWAFSPSAASLSTAHRYAPQLDPRIRGPSEPIKRLTQVLSEPICRPNAYQWVRAAVGKLTDTSFFLHVHSRRLCFVAGQAVALIRPPYARAGLRRGLRLAHPSHFSFLAQACPSFLWRRLAEATKEGEVAGERCVALERALKERKDKVC